MHTSSQLFVLILLIGATVAVSPAMGDGPQTDREPRSTVSPNPAQPEETAAPGLPYSLSFDASMCSKYLFQGIDYSGGPVVQPELVFGYRDFTATAWFNYQPGLSQWNEMDLTLKYGREIRKVTMAGGYNYLRYPNRGWDPSQELLLELSVEAPLHPAFNVHYDFGAGDGAYAQIGVSHPVTPRLSLGTNLFYQHSYYAVTGVPSMEIKASSQVSVGMLTFSPALSYFFSRDNGDFRDGARPPRTWLLVVNVARPLL
jgi:hypothetical protein